MADTAKWIAWRNEATTKLSQNLAPAARASYYAEYLKAVRNLGGGSWTRK